jgi:hypothetical protein
MHTPNAESELPHFNPRSHPCHQQTPTIGFLHNYNHCVILIAATLATSRHVATQQTPIDVSLRMASLVLLSSKSITASKLASSTRHHLTRGIRPRKPLEHVASIRSTTSISTTAQHTHTNQKSRAETSSGGGETS